MKEISAFNVRTRKKTNMKNPQLITMKNGKKAIKGIASDDGKTVLFRIVSAAQAAQFKTE